MWALSPRRRITTRLRGAAPEEGGFTLPELLIGASLMIVIMGAIYGVLTTFQNSAVRTNNQNNAQQEARAATDILAWQLRNLVMPASATTGPLEVSSAYDLVFQTIDPSGGGSNATRAGRVRYCY